MPAVAGANLDTMWFPRPIVLASTVLAAAAMTLAGSASAEPDAEPAEPAGPKTSMDADGTYLVGKDIVPGTYASQGPRDGSACYWKRAGGEGGKEKLDSALTKKPAVVAIAPTDLSFKTTSCQSWTLTNEPVPPPGSPMDILGGLGRIAIGAGSAPPPSR